MNLKKTILIVVCLAPIAVAGYFLTNTVQKGRAVQAVHVQTNQQFIAEMGNFDRLMVALTQEAALGVRVSDASMLRLQRNIARQANLLNQLWPKADYPTRFLIDDYQQLLMKVFIVIPFSIDINHVAALWIYGTQLTVARSDLLRRMKD